MATNTGVAFEEEVAQAYRRLGARVQHNIVVAGMQLDLMLVLREHAMEFRVAVECKDYSRNVPISEVRDFTSKCRILRSQGAIDKGVMVTRKGYTSQGKQLAEKEAISLLIVDDLTALTGDFVEYLTRFVENYAEIDDTHRDDRYIRLTTDADDGTHLGPVDDYLDQWLRRSGRQLTILGDYGTGKSTVVRRFVFRQAHRFLACPSAERIPLLINLREYQKTTSARGLITDLLINDFGVRIRDFPSFQDESRRGRFVLVLDGFDEMASMVDDRVTTKNFEQLMSLVVPGSKVILTCRTHYFRDQAHVVDVHRGCDLRGMLSETMSFEVIRLNPYTTRNIRSYLRKCFPRKHDRYWRRIQSVYDLEALAAKPILLAMIVSTLPHMSRSRGKLTSAKLYEAYVEFWFRRDAWRTVMNRGQREVFCEELACQLVSQRQTSIHFTKLMDVIRVDFPSINGTHDLDYFESDVRTCTFLHRDDAGNYFFVHRSFAEFFAATKLAREILGDGVTVLSIPSIASEGVLAFLLGLLGRRQVAKAIRKLALISGGSVTVEALLVAMHQLGEDTSGLDLTGIALSDREFLDYSLDGVRMQLAKIYGCDLVRCSLCGGRLSRASLADVKISDSDMRSARFDMATLWNVTAE
nr:NACHT domain-containing protein [PVC group bacterium]